MSFTLVSFEGGDFSAQPSEGSPKVTRNYSKNFCHQNFSAKDTKGGGRKHSSRISRGALF